MQQYIIGLTHFVEVNVTIVSNSCIKPIITKPLHKISEQSWIFHRYMFYNVLFKIDWIINDLRKDFDKIRHTLEKLKFK